MSERDDEIARVLRGEGSALPLARADALIAANVRHLPSLPDDPEAVERVARRLCRRAGGHTCPAHSEVARDLFRALAGGE